MSMMRWDPFRELISLREAMDRMFEESFVRPSAVLGTTFNGGFTVPVDVYQTPNEVVIKASLPGVKPEDVDINITGDILTIKGEVKSDEKIEKENYLRHERRYGSFYREVLLPGQIKADQTEAVFENGILKITVPKAEEAKPKQIKVKAQGIIEGQKTK